MASTSPTSSRSEVSVPQINVEHDQRPYSEQEDNNNLVKRIRTEAVYSLAEDMATLRDSTDLLLSSSDLTLPCQANQESFPVHKAILSARSDVFASMLAEGEAKNDIEIEDTNPDTLYLFVSYLYESKLPPLEQVDSDVWYDLLILANRYNVPALKNACKYILLSIIANIKPSQFVQLAIVGYQCK